MEVSVESVTGIPDGSILSIRAGSVRRQGTLPADRPVRFSSTSPLDACPFKVDVFSPLGSSRLVLKPRTETYSVSLNDGSDEGTPMKLDLRIRELNGEEDATATTAESRQARKQKATIETQAYIEEHEIVRFVQNLMTCVLADKPADPFLYMERHLAKMRQSGQDAEKSKPVPPPLDAETIAPAGKTPQTPRRPSRMMSCLPLELLVPKPRDFVGPAFVREDPYGQLVSCSKLEPCDLKHPNAKVLQLKLPSLSSCFSPKLIDSPLKEQFKPNREESAKFVTQGIPLKGVKTIFQLHRAMAPAKLHFNPEDVVASVVTCGGLCPGMNAVVRELVMMLYMYGARKIWGIIGGYKGIANPSEWIELTPEIVQDWHTVGGSLLVNDRGGPPVEEQFRHLREMGVRQHFIVGGYESHMAAYELYEEMKSQRWECAVVCVPKTIDNDIPLLERTFGFDTSCTEAKKAIDAAYLESKSNANSMTLVKLMGQDCGFIPQNASLAARSVDVVLLPEMEVSLEKLLSHCIHLMQTKGHAVIVVSEGCGETLVRNSEAAGTAKPADVGPWLRDQIVQRFKEVKLPLSIKYIDPTYLIRAVKSNANDSVYGSILAHNAVHAAMSGYTGVTSAQVQQRFVILPIQSVTKLPRKRVDLKGRWFNELVSCTLQPDLAPDGFEPARPVDLDPDVLKDCSEAVEVLSCLRPGDEVRRLELEHLKDKFGEKSFPTTLSETVKGCDLGFMDQNSWVVGTLGASNVRLQMLQAGPRHSLHFEPADVAATIVTCGGLCPGLNSVIRELVMTLFAYGVRKVYGIKGGYKGVVNPNCWLTLTPSSITDIHKQGGSILVSDRGNPPHLEMAKMLQKKGVRQHFVLGGDGTQKGAYQTYEQMQNIGWECAVVGIPKTIDNDINLLDRSFGFDTAMTEAENAIDTAYVEATCNANCIGLVKLMGRHCGYLTMMSCIAARHVDICLLPEMDISVEKVLDHCVALVGRQGYAVVVVGEGCGDVLLKGTGEKDAGGNKKISDVGPWLKDQITDHFKTLHLPITIKYVDPTYMVRAVPANANDSIYCSLLAQAAVHAAMAGYTGITVGKVDSNLAYLPIKMLTSLPSRVVDTNGRWFERLLSTTHQPNLEHTGISMAKPIDPTQASGRTPFSRGAVPRGLSKVTGSFCIAMMDEVRVPDAELKVIDGYGAEVERRPIRRGDLLRDTDEIRELACFHLSERYGVYKIKSTLKGVQFNDSFSWTTQAMYLGDRVDSGKGFPYYKMTRAGARENLHFDPHDPAACAAIVSCGGICPGLNSVIREVVNTLWDYGVRKIYGVIGGYKGVVEPENWVMLTPEVVKDIHLSGGTILISDRGNPAHLDMARTLQKMGVRQYFVLGGDGTHKGAMQTFDCCLEIDHECAVIGVPKTIDNDVPIFDQTFGFDTACTAAVRAVDSAYVEACCNANCIGLVKLMGRHCGFIAMNAALAARHVDICLLPEMVIDMEKVLQHTEALMRSKGHAVIVVAEGCGDTLIKSGGACDAGGNKVLADVGPWLKDTITARFKERGLPLSIKYIDPTYMIRSIPASSFDSAYCSVLGQMAVHGAMAGYSGVTVGKVYERYVYVPIHSITMQTGKRVVPGGRWFNRMVETTKQPNFRPSAAVPATPSGDVGKRNSVVLEALSVQGSINQLLQPGDEFRRLEVVTLASKFPGAGVRNPLLPQNSPVFLGENSWSTQTLMRFNKRDDRGNVYHQMLRSGPREMLHFDPAESSAVIVTCGGLCPGLNSVIREIVMSLVNYGVKAIYGCIGGYKGMVQPEKWVHLTPATVQDIDGKGGTVLVSDRGNPPHIEIAKTLQKMNIRQYFVIGGDGTQTGAFQTFECTQEINHEVAVVGIPKTIDNDIPILDRSFGFNTACSEAENAIASAYVEATSNTNCIGLVKLMGRHCGFIAMHATLAARSVDMCLLPEMSISLPKVFTHILRLMKKQGHAVIVVAEGCGDTLLESSGERDAGGNKKLADVGPWLREQLLGYFKKMRQPLTIKYIDPTYTIRAVPANANDSVYCSVLAQHAVHGAMAGYTGIIVGKVDERYVMLPTHAITKSPARRVNLKSRQFERMLATTGQPDLTPGVGDDWLLLPKCPPEIPEEEVEGIPPPPINLNDWKKLPPSPAGPAAVSAEVPDEIQVKILDGYGNPKTERSLCRKDCLGSGAEVRKLEVMFLADRYKHRGVKSPLSKQLKGGDFCDDGSWTVQAMSSSSPGGKGRNVYMMRSAGPRERLHFDPEDPSSCAAILTAGGLCPGENDVIREVVHMLESYGVKTIYGIKHGLEGIVDPESWIKLTPKFVQDITSQAGTILKSKRGNPSHMKIAESLRDHNVRQLFVLGGDGTHKGLMQICSALMQLDYECSCVGIPSTIDNDIPFVDIPYGFYTASSEARKTIDAAYVEATCNANCIGLVKLLGINTGFLTLTSALASRHVDICLLTEMEISLEKVLAHCETLMSTKGYAVVVVADGCGKSLFKNAGETPDDGDVGPWLRDKVLQRFKAKAKPLTIKYIDPTYMVRSVKANAFDTVYCSALAEHAVHGAMAGLTCITTVKSHESYVYVPLQMVCRSRKQVNTGGRWYARMLVTTRQPGFEPDGFTYPPADDQDESISTTVPISCLFNTGTEIVRLECANLVEKFTNKECPNPLKGIHGITCIDSSNWLTQSFKFRDSEDKAPQKYLQMPLSGPTDLIHFDPKEPGAAAAIVTCGGLCPGLNSVIREIVKMLHTYGVQKVYGIIGGFKGAVTDDKWLELTEVNVQDIHMLGGSMLVSDRGNPPHSEIATVMQRRNIRQYFVVGGDGTHKGAMQSFEAMTAINHECAVVGVPKTIDNDITLVDRTFGFDTACEEAKQAIVSAYVEATTNANCIGLVKLMGRHCGWIAATAALSTRHVDICLIPEMDISLPKLLDYVLQVMRRQKYAVIVVAEGCGDTIISGSGETDAGGNKMLADVGTYLKDQILAHCKQNQVPATIKYIDPTYMIRAVPANAFDSIYCSVLAQQAVHAAMTGYTGITVGKVDEHFVMLPIHSIVDKGARKVSLTGFTYQRLMAMTRQPNFAN